MALKFVHADSKVLNIERSETNTLVRPDFLLRDNGAPELRETAFFSSDAKTEASSIKRPNISAPVCDTKKQKKDVTTSVESAEFTEHISNSAKPAKKGKPKTDRKSVNSALPSFNHLPVMSTEKMEELAARSKQVRHEMQLRLDAYKAKQALIPPRLLPQYTALHTAQNGQPMIDYELSVTTGLLTNNAEPYSIFPAWQLPYFQHTGAVATSASGVDVSETGCPNEETVGFDCITDSTDKRQDAMMSDFNPMLSGFTADHM